jgi:hypothetical protein
MVPSTSGRLLAAMLATIVVVAACSGGVATPASPAAASAPIATQVTTPSAAPAATPTPSAAPGAVVNPSSAPSGLAAIDPCALLTQAEVTSALKFAAPPPQALGGYLQGIENDGKLASCSWTIDYPAVPEARILKLTVCQCGTSVPQFDAWAKSIATLQGVSLSRLPSIGERAYILGLGFGIFVRQHGVDFHIETQAVPGLWNLPNQTLDKNAKPYYTSLSKKVITRLP